MSEVETLDRPKLSKVPAGWWQNKFHSERDAVFGAGHVNKAGEWFSPNHWPSRDVAETRAQQHLVEFAAWCEHFGITYRGAVHFTEAGEA